MYRSSHFEVSSSAVLTAFTLLCGHHRHHLQGFPISQLKLHIRWTLTFPAFPQLLATTVLPTVSRSLTPLGPHLSGILGACPLLTGLLTELGTLKVNPCCNMCQKFLFFFFFWGLHGAWMLVPWLGIEPVTLAVALGVLTPGPPGGPEAPSF